MRLRVASHVFNHALTQRAGRMFFGHGSVPCVVIGRKHPYLNTEQTLTANLSKPLELATHYRASGLVLWPKADLMKV